MDFDAILGKRQKPLPVKPRAVWDSLRKAHGYGYLRDVQGVVLTEWDERRGEADIVIKVNTGGGKTIDGLVILQSYLNDGVVPALYVAPSSYLAQRHRGVLNVASMHPSSWSRARDSVDVKTLSEMSGNLDAKSGGLGAARLPA